MASSFLINFLRECEYPHFSKFESILLTSYKCTEVVNQSSLCQYSVISYYTGPQPSVKLRVDKGATDFKLSAKLGFSAWSEVAL